MMSFLFEEWHYALIPELNTNINYLQVSIGIIIFLNFKTYDSIPIYSDCERLKIIL